MTSLFRSSKAHKNKFLTFIETYIKRSSEGVVIP